MLNRFGWLLLPRAKRSVALVDGRPSSRADRIEYVPVCNISRHVSQRQQNNVCATVAVLFRDEQKLVHVRLHEPSICVSMHSEVDAKHTMM